MTEWLRFHFSLSCIGEGNGNPHQCSYLRIPGTGEPVWLRSLGSHRVGHDWSDLAAAWYLFLTWHKIYCFAPYNLCSFIWFLLHLPASQHSFKIPSPKLAAGLLYFYSSLTISGRCLGSYRQYFQPIHTNGIKKVILFLQRSRNYYFYWDHLFNLSNFSSSNYLRNIIISRSVITFPVIVMLLEMKEHLDMQIVLGSNTHNNSILSLKLLLHWK